MPRDDNVDSAGASDQDSHGLSQSGGQTAQYPATDKLSEGKARLIVEQLLERDVVEMDADTPVLHHVPTGYTFESNEALAHFHTGWQNGRGSHDTADE